MNTVTGKVGSNNWPANVKLAKEYAYIPNRKPAEVTGKIGSRNWPVADRFEPAVKISKR